jgi:hypothetical protein
MVLLCLVLSLPTFGSEQLPGKIVGISDGETIIL